MLGTRVALLDRIECLAGAMNEDEPLSDDPTLTREDNRAVLACAATRECRWNQPPTA